MKKTVEQHLQQCDEPWAKKALKYVESSEYRNELVLKLSDAIALGFIWSYTDEGRVFWDKIYDDLLEAGK